MEIVNTQVHIFRPSTPFVHLVVTPFTETVTYVFTVDLFTGSLLFSSTPYVDIFKSHRQACSFIVSKYNKPSFRMQEWQGKGLIGITIDNQNLVIGLVEGARKCGSLPNGSVIKQITSTNFVTIPLKSGSGNSKTVVNNFPIDKMHFFCETMDLTRPYPSDHFVNDYDESFCWNQRWRLPFARFGVEFVCIVLLQGYAKTSSCSPFITYIIRRSVLNPYTRYTSRGTDDEGSPGNEAECELIFFKENDNQKFASNCWRRGSIPMMWKTVVGAVGSGQHIISQEQRNVTSVYFDKISQRFENIPMAVISLLNDSEFELNEAYKEAVKPLNFVRFFSFDILKVPENQRIEQFQAFMKPIIIKEDCFTIGDKNGIIKKQKMIFRFNCVDSTDRTNVATFVYGRILTEIKLGPLSNDQKLHKGFLANAFIEGGDVISLLYTSTEAALTKAIRDTVENMSQAKHDTSLACIRRVKHIYGNDTFSDKVIESWISKGGILNSNPYFSLDYFYLSLIQDSSMNFRKISLVDPSVVSYELTSTKVNSIDGSVELIIQLPMPMVIGVIRLLFLPSCFGDIPKSFTLSCGMNSNERNIYLKDVMIPDVKEPTIVKYSLYHAYRWGIQAPLEQKACEPVRFVFITFKQCSKIFPTSTASMGLLSFNVDKNSRLNNESKNQTNNNNNQNASNQPNPYLSMNHNHNKTSRFSTNNVSPVQSSPKIAIGNVLIDAYIPSMVSKIPSFDNEKTEIVDKYKKEIESFLSQPNESMLKSKSIDSYIKLELFRIKNRIPFYIRNQILIEKGINPIITSIRHYIHRRNDHSLCLFCHEKLDINNNLFVFHEQFKSLLIPFKNIPHCNQNGFPLCKKCRDKIENCKNELTEIDSMVIKEEPPCFSLRHWKIGEIKEQVCLSRKPLATFLEFPKSSSENDNDIDKLLFSDDEEEIEETNEVKEMTPKSESKPNLIRQKRSHACRNSLRTKINSIKISNYNSCITADVIQCNDIISRSIDIDIDNDTFTYISNQSDDDVINCETNKTIVEEKNDDSSQQFIKKVDSVPCFNKNETSIDEDTSKIKYIIDSSTQKVFTFTLCLSSFSVPNELVITFEGNLPEKVEIIAFKNKANTATTMPRSISTTAKASMISPSSSSVTTPPRSAIKSPQFSAELQNSIQQSNHPSTPKRSRVSILDNNDDKEQNFKNAHLSLPPTSASISELNPRKHASIMVKHEDKIFVQFDPIQTSSLTFVICAEEDQEEIIMKHVKVLGNFIEKPHPNPSWYSFPVPHFNGNKMMGSWDPETQTHTYAFKNQNILRRINFKVPYNMNGSNCVTKNQGVNGSSSAAAAVSSAINGSGCDKKSNSQIAGGIGSNKSCGNISGLFSGIQSCCHVEQMPQSVLLALYNDKGKLVKNFHILIPQPMPPFAPTNCKEVEMNFQIADSPVFSTIKLFYLDQIDKLKPFDVSFLASPIENEK